MTTLNNFDANQVLKKIYDNTGNYIRVSAFSPPAPIEYDNLLIGYISGGNGDGEIGTVTYFQGVTQVAEITITYDASNRISTVTWA